MNTLQQFNQEVMVKNTELIDQGKEEFSVVKSEIANNKFNITVQNTGNLPVNITRLWIQNKTDPNWGTFKYDINVPLSPGAVAVKIGQNIPLYAKNTQGYNIKLTTERGNAEEFSINSPSAERLAINLYAIPEYVTTDFTATVLMTVTNNMSNHNTLLDVRPTMTQASFTTCVSGSCVVSPISGPTPTSVPYLASGDTAIYRWVYQLSNAAPDDQVTFTAQLVNGYPGQTVSAVATIKEIVSSLTSGTALTSFGSSTLPKSNNTLFMHLETQSVPSARYQLHPPLPDLTGPNSIRFENTVLKFFTKNGSQTMKIPLGTWSASIRYSSASMPDNTGTLQDNSHGGQIFHFNANADGSALPSNYPRDSTGDTSIDCWQFEGVASGKPSGSAIPAWSATYGVNGSGAYRYDGDAYWVVGTSTDCNQVGSANDATAGWFKADKQDSYHTKQVIWDVGGNTDDFWEISIGDGTSGASHGKLFFKFDTGPSTATVTCSYTSGGASGLMDGNWHHFTAVRTGTTAGTLYVDSATAVNCSVSSPIDTTVDPNTNLFIGRDASSSASFFWGYLDDLIHWNNDDLSSSERTNVKNANFGTAAHKAKFELSKTDKNGVFISSIPTFTTNSYSLPFVDPRHFDSNTGTDGDRDNYWAGANYTKTGVEEITLSPDHRLNYTMSFVSGADIDVVIDDTRLDGTSDPLSSYIQYPLANATFASYFQYDRCASGLFFWTANAGPYGSWFTFAGTRISLNDIISTKSYAGIIHRLNGTTLDENTDSIFLPVAAKGQLEFYPPQSRPDKDTSPPDATTVPVGNYNMYLFIDGYDETGKTFLRTIDVGVVNVYASSSSCLLGN